ncbi:DMT family transporter [Hippea alviniae]|uniref:DMT family transporter n=1 Tax=Hippea alviniae TaxID=1279027 RepID=UPI0003B766B2|nr:DMT family transporter [Hippea alviniae]
MFKLSKEYIADLLLLSVTIFWGSTFIIVKESINMMPTFAFLSIRFWIASILLILMFSYKLKHLNRELIRDGVILGIVLFLAYAFQTVALEYEKASIVGFLTGLNVIFTPILSAFLLKKVPSVFSQVGALLAFVGMGMMSFKGGLSLSKGDLLTIICAIFVAIQIVLTDRYSRKHDTYLLTVVEITILAILSTLVNLASEPYLFPKKWNMYLIGSFLITAIFATVYAFVIQNTAQKYTTPTKTAIIFVMEPVFAAIFGYLLGGEVLSLRAYIGAVIMFAGLFMAEVGPALVKR